MVDEEEAVASERVAAARYQIEGVIGRGGMGTVYRVLDTHSGQHRALKRGTPTDARKTQRRSALLEREYYTLVQLAHPRIIEVLEYGVDADGPYYTMELLAGGDLQDRARTPWQQACALLYDVASSLAILHARGLLHRDVSLRNVRCTLDGRAKLIDFGAMAPIGIARDLVGTAPFIAPEALQLQELDARADLFSLGAVGYYLLTGRNAYPARKISELRDVWRSRPPAPARLVADVPPALSALILQLLMLDRGARPRNAAEVMERLCAIAELPAAEHVEVSRAYLTTPALVGRDQALVQARRQILSLVRREGGTLLIEGVAGSGRSRMLDACVLEGKLLGVTVVRANAGHAASGEWGVARALCNELTALMREPALAAARLSRGVLRSVVDALDPEGGLAGDGSASETATQPERSLLLRELRDFVLTLSQSQKLMLAVDDVDEIDEPSAALLAAIANKCNRHSLIVAVSTKHEQALAGSASLRLLRLVGRTIELNALQPEETHALVRSIFGDVPNVEFVAGSLHGLAHGSPRATIELAQHLCERGLARYESGSWLLPSRLDERDLPQTLADALASRLAALSPDARAIVDVQCITAADALGVSDYAELAQIEEHKRLFAALDELLSARVFVLDGEGYRFTQRGFAAVARAGISEPRRSALHARIADHLGRLGGDVARRADHLLSAGRAQEAIELLSSIDLLAQLPPVALLERAIERAEQLGTPPRVLHQLRVALVSKASVVLAADSFRRCLPFVLAQLERDSGLCAYRELSNVPAAQRLERALAETQQRYLATPVEQRVQPWLDAMRELARVSGAVCSFATQVYDLEVLEALPPLEPFEPLSPALNVVAQVVAASTRWVSGQMHVHRRIASEVLERIAQPDRGGMDEAQQTRTRLGLHYAVGLYEASLGSTGAEVHAAQLDSDRNYRVNAWKLRMLMHLNQGNVEEARKCERRAETLQLQESGEQRYLQMGAGYEVSALAEAGDLVGVKSCVETLNAMAELYPGWRPSRAYGTCRYRWLQGDLEGALEALLPAFEHCLPARHNFYGMLAGVHLRLLAELGRIEEGATRGRRYLELCQHEQLGSQTQDLTLGLCAVFSAAGQWEDAVRTIEARIEASVALGSAGMSLGVLYEARARLAVRMADPAGFEHFAELCAAQYKLARNAVLNARFARLLEDARQQDVGTLEPAVELRALLQLPAEETEYNTVHSRLVECVDDGDRARCALSLLLQSTESGAGLLFGVRDGRATLLAALPEGPDDPALARWVDECLSTGFAGDVTVTAHGGDGDGDGPTRTGEAVQYFDSEGRCLEPVFMIAGDSGPSRVAAVLVLHIAPGQRTVPSRMLLGELARELLEYGDVTGLTIEEAVTRDDRVPDRTSS